MHTETNTIVQQLFGKDHAGQIEDAALEAILSQYPYLSVARYLAAWRKYRQGGNQLHEELVTAGLYVNNPMWLQWLLENYRGPDDAGGGGTDPDPLSVTEADKAEGSSISFSETGGDSSALTPAATESFSAPMPEDTDDTSPAGSAQADAAAVEPSQASAPIETDEVPPVGSAQADAAAEPPQASAQAGADEGHSTESLSADATEEGSTGSVSTNVDPAASPEPTATSGSADAVNPPNTDDISPAEPARAEAATESSAGSTPANTNQTSPGGSAPVNTEAGSFSGPAAFTPERSTAVDSHTGPANTAGEKTPSSNAVKTLAAESGESLPIVFQSYHTIDYFASQGIRLQQADLTKDRFGQQLKSFTEWLRSMKKLPPTGAAGPAMPEDPGRQQLVIRNAASSLEDREVYTEAMAEVWAKQGNAVKARSIYEKLSLLNPSKSTYFAAKIDQLKAV